MRYLLILLVLMFAEVANAIDCEKVPTCEELGYSQDDDPYCAENGYMYCPLDYSYKKCVNMDCAKLGFTEDDKTSWCGKLAKCKGNPRMTLCQNLCEVGDVYYADGTCGYVEDYDGSKTPVGVVYYVTDEGRHGRVINLHDLGKESETSPFDPRNPYNTKFIRFYWGYHSYDIPKLPNYDSSNIVDKLKAYDPDLYNGKGNTDKILEDSGPADCDYDKNTQEYYQYCITEAAQAARDFYPPEVDKNDSKVGQGKWYLPALGELLELYGYDNSLITDYLETTGQKGDNKILINNTLNALKDKGVVANKLANAFYWSSSEYSNFASWRLNVYLGYRAYNNKYYNFNVRASMEF